MVRDGGQVVWRVRRRLRLGDGGFIAGRETLHEYVTDNWAHVHARHLAPKTRGVYGRRYDRHVGPRLGGMALSRISPEVVARFQADLIAANVGPEARRKSVVLPGGILQRAAEGKRLACNPVRLVLKAPAEDAIGRARRTVGARPAR